VAGGRRVHIGKKRNLTEKGSKKPITRAVRSRKRFDFREVSRNASKHVARQAESEAVFDILKNKRETSKVGCREGSDTELYKKISDAKEGYSGFIF
jgi:hypothetical protein